MRIYIVDDDKNVIKILERIIIDKNLGDIVGSAQDGITALEEIKSLRPDIALVDLLMPGMDGISLVKEIKSIEPNIQFIMISQVSTKDMISKAYESGIEYYISKPIDVIEVQTVIKKVQEKIDINKKLYQIQSLFTNESNISNLDKSEEDSIAGIKRVMQKIGILGR